MVKVEHNACLSTSMSSSVAPPLIVEAPRSESNVGNTEKKSTRRQSDYIVVLVYIIIYLEVGWLIFMILRMYSRN